ncbi:MAG: hypothetical protein M3502_06400 [Actinomycetota bacterium]|nr:hypothetical protein [Actinomycetota bacterium]
MVNLRRLLLATTLTLLASLAVAGSVAATPGNGAQVFDESGCLAVDSGTICFDIRTVQKVTETPSGNFLYRGRGESSYSFTGAGRLEGCSSSTSDESNYHYLVRDGVSQVAGDRYREELSVDCLGQTGTCTFSYQAHFANGEVQFTRQDPHKCLD